MAFPDRDQRPRPAGLIMIEPVRLARPLLEEPAEQAVLGGFAPGFPASLRLVRQRPFALQARGLPAPVGTRNMRDLARSPDGHPDVTALTGEILICGAVRAGCRSSGRRRAS